jgi:hypothetical protein
LRQTTKILNLIYCLTILLFLLDSLTSFDIKSQFLKSSVYFGFLIETPTILLCNLFLIKTKTKQIVGTVYPTIFLILIFVVNPLTILFSSGAWRTQEILYENKHLSFKKVEFQMQDIGASGYNRRTVEVIYLTPLFMITNEVPNDINKRVEWTKVNEDMNELELKSP